MLMHLLTPLADEHIFFNLFNYLTFRAAGGMVTAILLALVFGPRTIRWLRQLRFGQVVREEGPETHLKKAGTPTMGGVLILISTAVATMLWADILNRYVIITLLVFVWLGVLGFLDDYLKVVRRRTEGLVGRYKLVGQGVIGLIVGVTLLLWPLSPVAAPNWTTLPFVSDFYVKISTLLLRALGDVHHHGHVERGESDRRTRWPGRWPDRDCRGHVRRICLSRWAASTPPATSGFSIWPAPVSWPSSACALAGAALGFLWFNAHPAEVFMGDTGALALGGALGTVALLLKLEFLLAIVGGVFVMEALSVMAQVGYFKYTAAPLRPGPASAAHGAAASPLREVGLDREQDHRAFLDPRPALQSASPSAR